jgi:hypothetical protein
MASNVGTSRKRLEVSKTPAVIKAGLGFSFRSFVFSQLARSLVPVTHDSALKRARSLVPRVVIFGDQPSVSFPQPLAVKSGF